MKRSLKYISIVLVLIAGGVIASRGCYDPTENAVQVTGQEPVKQRTIIEGTDVKFELTADNTDVKWTGSNVAGQTPYGYFYDLSGQATLDDDANLKAIEMTFEMDSVRAMNKSLTEKLKNKGFLEVDKFPTSRFESTSITAGPREGDPEGTTHVIEGNFQLRDVTRSIQIPVVVDATAETLKLTSEFSINRKDYGVLYSNSVEDAAIRDGVLLNISVNVP